MDPFNPALDQPRLIDHADLDPGARFPLANCEIRYQSDRDSDLHDLYWSWHGRTYAHSIRIHLAAPIYTRTGISSAPVDDVLPIAVRFYPGYQETIYGVEGVIVSKRTFAPLSSNYDRSVLWLLECQAEGHRLVQIAVEIDWGEPLEQRVVDGLLVVQSHPGAAKGIHGQRNAESTRVFGAAQGRPDFVNFPGDSRAQLVYHVLVAGQVDLSLILSLSDVGEQVAWNGFLVQRDIGRAFARSRDAWHRVTHRGRLWTPYPPLNRAVQQAKVAAVGEVERLRTGLAPRDRVVRAVPAWVALFDAFDVERSRGLLDHLRRVAERTQGRLPVTLPAHPRETPDDPGPALIDTAAAYLSALTGHLRRQPSHEILEAHFGAVRLCAEAVIAARSEAVARPEARRQAATLLTRASDLARRRGDSVDAARWASEAAVHRQVAGGGQKPGEMGDPVWVIAEQFGESVFDTQYLVSNHFVDQAIWTSCGLSWEGETLAVRPRWPVEWGWWALLDLPAGDRPLSLLWDGETLHATRSVQFDGPVAVHETIRTTGSDEDGFNLRFHLDGGRVFRPRFYTVQSWRDRTVIRGREER